MTRVKALEMELAGMRAAVQDLAARVSALEAIPRPLNPEEFRREMLLVPMAVKGVDVFPRETRWDGREVHSTDCKSARVPDLDAAYQSTGKNTKNDID